ncbi:hypothetical protein J1N35_020102 [Gossypium stocksii]|uniref:Reticulon-like protein n=1 Tax=Gossypium stocksii TaxID=47602 RepID=A0A9D3VCL3_9ROSI|nr:hypothetical protein J1N35_020102 [Gossypium stocksii]
MIHRLIPMTISHQKLRSNTRSFVSLGEKDPSTMFSLEANRLTFSYGGTKRHQPEPSGIARIQPSPSSALLVDAYTYITSLVVKCYYLHPQVPNTYPEVQIPKDPVLECAQALRFEINCDFSVLQEIASGRDLKKFLSVIASLWVLSIVGSWCNFLTLFYIGIAVVFTLLLPYKRFGFRVFFSFCEQSSYYFTRFSCYTRNMRTRLIHLLSNG